MRGWQSQVGVFLKSKENYLPEERLAIRHTREILRLYFESQLSPRQIAAICKVGKGTIQRYLERLKSAELSWPLPADLDDVALERRLFPPPPVGSSQHRPLPDFAVIHKELKGRKNVTLQLLWEEYKQSYPEGYAYSWYCESYRHWHHRLDVVLRHEHRAGEKTFVDYAGQTVPVIDPKTGEVRQAQVFVAVLGASNYTYAEATWTQNLWDWINSHVRAFEFFEGTSSLVIPDNLKSGVNKPCYYEPELNRTYGDLAIHYGVGILPARPYRPRDKDQASYCTSLGILNASWGYCRRSRSRLPGSAFGKGPLFRIEQQKSAIVGAYGAEYALAGETFGGAEVYVHPCCDLGRSEPSVAAKMFGI
jgi:transposase